MKLKPHPHESQSRPENREGTKSYKRYTAGSTLPRRQKRMNARQRKKMINNMLQFWEVRHQLPSNSPLGKFYRFYHAAAMREADERLMEYAR